MARHVFIINIVSSPMSSVVLSVALVVTYFSPLLHRYSIIRSCCQWSPQHRLSMSELIRKLQAGEVSANGRTILRVPEPLDIEKYMREAGYGEAYNYAVL